MSLLVTFIGVVSWRRHESVVWLRQCRTRRWWRLYRGRCRNRKLSLLRRSEELKTSGCVGVECCTWQQPTLCILSVKPICLLIPCTFHQPPHFSLAVHFCFLPRPGIGDIVCPLLLSRWHAVLLQNKHTFMKSRGHMANSVTSIFETVRFESSCVVYSSVSVHTGS